LKVQIDTADLSNDTALKDFLHRLRRSFESIVLTNHDSLANLLPGGGIYAPTCPGLAAVARALESVDKGKGVIKLAGTCVPSITAKYMLDGTIQGFYLWDPVKLGYVTYYAAKLFSQGKIQGKVGDSFVIKEGKWPGNYQIDANSQIVTGQPLQYTPENVSENDY
jgi:rhamnose transport system substrate-binding protein